MADDFLSNNNYPENGVDSHDVSYHEDLSTSIGIYKKATYSRLLNRYRELLLTTIDYEGCGVTSAFSIQKIEMGLRNNYKIAVGMCKDNKARMIGYVTNDYTSSSAETFMTYIRPLHGSSLIETVPSVKFDYSKAVEITPDFPNTGNFVVLRNKPVSFANEYSTIALYCQKLAEIEATRYSIVWQAKAMTGFIGEENDSDVNHAINLFYNGNPFFKAGLKFDKDDIFQIDNTKVAEILAKLSEEKRDTENDLLSQMGINSVGVSKASGVSDLEASTSSLSTTAYANVLLTGRNMGLRLFNDKYPDSQIFAKIRSDLNIPDALNNKESNNDGNSL